MRWLRFSLPGQDTLRYGCIDDDDRVTEIRGAPWEPHDVTAQRYALADVKTEVPLIPRTFYAAGLNYVKHIQEYAAQTGKSINVPTQADIGYRAVNALIADGEDVVIPEGATQMEYEGELVVVIGKRARHVAHADAMQCVFGYTLGNDVSERAWQASDRTFWRCKNSDTFKPMGPWIDTAFDLAGAETRVSVNDAVTTRFATGDMLFDIPTFISRMSQNLTLYPGDVIWMGTDGHSPTLRAGDRVQVEITGLGVLRNPFVSG